MAIARARNLPVSNSVTMPSQVSRYLGDTRPGQFHVPTEKRVWNSNSLATLMYRDLATNQNLNTGPRNTGEACLRNLPAWWCPEVRTHRKQWFKGVATHNCNREVGSTARSPGRLEAAGSQHSNVGTTMRLHCHTRSSRTVLTAHVRVTLGVPSAGGVCVCVCLSG